MTKRTKILEIHRDEDPADPRLDMDHPTTMVCWHRNYKLGDEQPGMSPQDYCEDLVRQIDESFLEALEEKEEEFFVENNGTGAIEIWQELYDQQVTDKLDEHYIILPLYLYDHGQLSISTGAFSCPWDSGQVGFIYISREKAAEEYGVRTFPELRYKGEEMHEFQSLDELAEHYMRSEVETYDQYLRGEIYGFILREDGDDGEEIDSCWGFYGSDWRTNGIAEHIDLSEVKAVHYMEPQSFTRDVAVDIEEINDGS